jgi:hypothetical protein
VGSVAIGVEVEEPDRPAPSAGRLNPGFGIFDPILSDALSGPFGVPDVQLPAWHLLDVLW